MPHIEIRNARVVDDNQDKVISRGELCKVIFEIYNTGQRPLYDIQPSVVEATGNKQIFISPGMHVERLMPGAGIRYTAMLKAGPRLGDGSVRICLSVLQGDNDHVLAAVTKLLGVIIHKDGVAGQVVYGDVEEALNLVGVQVHGQHTVGAGPGDQVGHQLGGNGVTGLGLTILTGVAKVGDDGGDAAGRGALESVDHDQQLHQVVVDRVAGGLDDKHVCAADRLENGDGAFAVGEALNVGLPRGCERRSCAAPTSQSADGWRAWNRKRVERMSITS